MKTLLLTLCVLLIAVVLMGIRVLFIRGGQFPRGHAHEIMSRKLSKANKSTHSPYTHTTDND